MQRTRNRTRAPSREALLIEREKQRIELERMMSSRDTFKRHSGKMRPLRRGYQDREEEDEM